MNEGAVHVSLLPSILSVIHPKALKFGRGGRAPGARILFQSQTVNIRVHIKVDCVCVPQPSLFKLGFEFKAQTEGLGHRGETFWASPVVPICPFIQGSPHHSFKPIVGERAA